MKKREFELFELSSGMRWVHRHQAGPVAHLALVVKAGSRDEAADEQGMAHFVEHCLFKGTAKRKTFHILSRLDDVGGELNAYTSKEETLIYASVLKKDAARALELLFDIAFHSTFPEREIAKERDVIMDEINSYRDSPSDLIFDLFDEQIFAGHPMGRNILGTPDHLRSFSREKTLGFHHRLYRPDQIVVASAGSIRPERFAERVSNWISHLDIPDTKPVREALNGYTPEHRVDEMPYVQTHCVLGNRAYGNSEERSLSLVLLNNLLGGPGMNNRLNLRIRERYGLTYQLESFYSAYSDCGIWGVYLSTEPEQADRVVELVHKELRALREKSLGQLQLSKAKKQLQGQIVLGQENPGSSISAIAKTLLQSERVESLPELMKRIEAISSVELMETANEVFDPSRFSSIHLKPLPT